MARKQWKIEVSGLRVRDTRGTSGVGMLLENLRYAGVVGNVECKYSEDAKTEFYSFSVYAPKGIVESVWAEQNSQRMRTFGLKANPVSF